MTTLRSLIAELGFQVDTTPADRFNTAVNKSKNNLKGLSQVNLGGFNKKLKGGFATATSIILAGLGSITGLLTADAAAKIIRLEGELKLGFKGLFDPLRAEIDDILTDPLLKNLTTEIELLEAAAAAAGQGINRAFIIENLQNVLELSTVFRKNLAEGTGLFIDFIKTGDLDLFLRLGKFTATQEQYFQRSKTTPGELGIPARRILLTNFFQEYGDEIKKELQDVIAKGGLTQKQLLNTLDQLAVEIGTKTLPIIQAFNKALIPLIEGLTRFVSDKELTPEQIKTEEEARAKKRAALKKPILPESFREPIIPEIINFFQDKSIAQIFSDISTKLKQPLFTPLQTTDQSNTTTEINTTIIVQPGATGDPDEIRKVVRDENGRIFGRLTQQSKNTRLRHGSGEGR